ncbi:NADH-quinone oxidoreductase subunit C [Arcticibacterium luteifluviistationis]|uniref:NADH-quinone oxidoreductase subunit C n=1 Tax=Arcticibacterium luteifluviistationis TaxID=1784714 RepID=A0A2Z4GH67_9BACT|nr:NADH-quinone oxidoreductase subunit C [Arcticibacterium luteifluviistationis]AWW00597.1 NADH-quinone oxidoreductase subunit C [Arcticibacterium luteifluviistationis]
MISHQEIVDELVGHFGTKVTEFEEPHGLLTFVCQANDIIDILEYLKESDRLKFRFLTDITGIHFPDAKGKEFGVVYHLHSFENAVRLRIKVYLSKEDINIPTAVNVYVGANWMERETFDFYGIKFTGHPNLIRILNMDEMDYHPMRKEYPLEDASREDKIDALFGR